MTNNSEGAVVSEVSPISIPLGGDNNNQVQDNPPPEDSNINMTRLDDDDYDDVDLNHDETRSSTITATATGAAAPSTLKTTTMATSAPSAFNSAVPSSSTSCKADSTIVTLATIHTVLIALLLSLPFVIANNDSGHGNEEGFADVVRILAVIVLVGGAAAILSIVTLSVACCCCRRWNQLSLPMKILALYPIVCDLLIVSIVALIGKINSTEGDNDGPSPIINGCVEGINGLMNCTTLVPKDPFSS